MKSHSIILTMKIVNGNEWFYIEIDGSLHLIDKVMWLKLNNHFKELCDDLLKYMYQNFSS